MEFVTIATFTLPSELAVIKGKLESEGIDCFVKDELTVQVHNFLSNAVGGIKLQVRNTDASKATELLKDMGYLKGDNSQPSRFWTFVDRKTKNIPYLKNRELEHRLFVLMWAILAIPVLIVIVAFVAILML